MFDDEAAFSNRLISLTDDAFGKPIIFSPSSILTGLALFYVGCEGETAAEIEEIISKSKYEFFGYDEYRKLLIINSNGRIRIFLGKSKQEIIDQISTALKHYKECGKNKKENFKVKFANKVFIANWCELLQNYCDTVSSNFNGGFQLLDFGENEMAVSVWFKDFTFCVFVPMSFTRDQKVASPQICLKKKQNFGFIIKPSLSSSDNKNLHKFQPFKEINNFVKTETNGLIKKIVEKNDIDKSTAAVLVNALYFKAPWELLFESFKTMEFKSNPPKTIKMMCKEVRGEMYGWNYVESEKWRALGIPYENYKAWIYFVLPNENYSLKDLPLNGDNFRQWTTRNYAPFINVAIPFIDVTYGLNMNEKLKQLGMKTAFTDKCNVSNMTKSSLCLKNVFHKATITIDEKGTEASAATACCCYPRSAAKPKVSFIADRPFLYFITTVKEPKPPKIPKAKNDDGNIDDDERDEDYINPFKCSTEPFNLLFVGTFC